ncbi:MAG: hypothetical protein V4510_09470 [bacterium]
MVESPPRQPAPRPTAASARRPATPAARPGAHPLASPAAAPPLLRAAAAPAEPKFQRRDVVPFWIAVAAPFLVYSSFMNGFSNINRSEPLTGPAGAAYSTCVVLAGAAVVAAAVFTRRHAMRLGIAAAIAAVLGFWLATTVEQGYGPTFLFWPSSGGGIFGAIAILFYGALGLAVAGAILMATKGGSKAADVVVPGGVGIAAGVGGAAAYQLATLNHQADLARQANHIPGVELVLLVVVLGALVACRRRWA